MKQLAKLKTLSKHEGITLVKSVVLLPLLALSLRITGFTATRKFLAFFIPEKGIVQLNNKDVDSTLIARMVCIAAKYGPYKANCLKQSLLLWWLLAIKGIKSDLRIGVNKDNDNFYAHSWVECEGLILIGGDKADKKFILLI